jgi:hypothetical protein
MSGTKHIDPALCIYIGASLICIVNKHMKDNVPRRNGTLCRVLGVKLRENAPSHKVKNYDGKKVWTVNAKHVEWIQCEHVNIPGHMVQLETKDIIILSSWPTGGLSPLFKNWEYVVLSRVRTLSGLYLVEPIDMDKSFNPSPQLKSYMKRAMRKEKEILEKRRIAMSQIIW